MRHFLLFLILICSSSVKSQVSLAWSKAVGTSMNTSAIDHKIDPWGNLFVFGSSDDTLCGYDAFFISKLDPLGNELYQAKLFSDSACDIESPAAFSIGNGNHLLTCGQRANNQPGGLLLGLDMNMLSFSWRQDTEAYFVDCINGFSNENYVVGNNPPEIQKWSQTGNLLWSFNWVGPAANAVQTFKDHTDGVYMLVNTFNTIPTTYSSGFGLVKRDTINVTGWVMFFNPSPTTLNRPIGAVQDSSENTYVLSKTTSSPSDTIFISKVSSSGQVQWTSFYSPCPYAYDLKYDLLNGNLLALVRVNGAIKVVRFDTAGALLDTTTAINTQFATGFPVFDVDTLGNSYVAYEFPVSSSSFTLYINKYNNGGGLLWSYAHTTSQPYFPSCLSVHSDGSVYVSATINNPSFIADSIFVIKLDQPLDVPDPYASDISVAVFPNPVNDDFYYQFSGNADKDFRYCITDISGRPLSENKCATNGIGQIDFSSLSPAVYFISFLNNNGELIAAPQKIIKL
ncbi:MAG: T9SS type A sorting domain-containing protein [Bacteroidota bacterium]|nr:T9SS type A sorting domain-containing protein [Bacteroidota bacterium]